MPRSHMFEIVQAIGLYPLRYADSIFRAALAKTMEFAGRHHFDRAVSLSGDRIPPKRLQAYEEELKETDTSTPRSEHTADAGQQGQERRQRRAKQTAGEGEKGGRQAPTPHRATAWHIMALQEGSLQVRSRRRGALLLGLLTHSNEGNAYDDAVPCEFGVQCSWLCSRMRNCEEQKTGLVDLAPRSLGRCADQKVGGVIGSSQHTSQRAV
eukprot:CAMPEP_0174704570 /NCGR_PEP_ID=MMETSP1094-20130205/8109_1 /TAXON_ID=156173 /ORGANISM="Chrysochromulina brevifilum, Strain UTEX LB 985" /LENGTH=209 /DNA_ID=CAMNT_0015902637 /DNA_START=112 /DNA_END=743 /DNA_ORIENTATION=+